MPEPSEEMKNLALTDQGSRSVHVRVIARLTYALPLMLILLISLIVVAVVVTPSAETCKVASEFVKKLTETRYPLEMLVFMNNAFVLLLLFIPFVNIFISGVVIYNSASMLKCFITSFLGSKAAILSLSLLMMPHSYLEMYAYALALVQGSILGLTIIKRRNVLKELQTTALVLIIALLILALSAIVEIAPIRNLISVSGFQR